MASNTETSWWHDSCEPSELKKGIEYGAVGVTTNPCLVQNTVHKNTDGIWDDLIRMSKEAPSSIAKAEKLVEGVFKNTIPMFAKWAENGAAKAGRVCAQVCPKMNSDRQWLIEAAK